MKIGFFDSGLGGLLVANATRTLMPQYDYVYYGDTANVPYGDRSEMDIYQLTKAGVTALFNSNCAIVVVACNTASVASLRRLQDEWIRVDFPDKKLLGVVIPTVEVLGNTHINKALLLATQRTVRSGKYEAELAKLNSNIQLLKQATPQLVSLIESGDYQQAATEATAYIRQQLANCSDISVVILGCTHYSVLAKSLRTEFPDLTFLAQTEIIPSKLQTYIEKHTELKSELTLGGTFDTYFTESGHSS